MCRSRSLQIVSSLQCVYNTAYMAKGTIGVIGTGKLGLCMALLFEEVGYNVIGVDSRAEYVEALNERSFYSSEEGVYEALNSAKNFYATTEITEVLQKQVDTLFVVVPTTTSSEMTYAYVALEKVVEQIEIHGFRSRPVQFVIVSTTPPGYCQKIADKLRLLNYQVVYHPEFIAQGTIIENLRQPDSLLIGQEEDTHTTALQEILYAICLSKPQLRLMSLLSAEITKLSLNCFLTMKIAFANAIGDLSLQVGGECEKILRAISDDKRIEPSYLSYGFGYGGPCLPRDNQALNSYAMQVGVPLYLSTAAQLANQAHLFFQKAQYLAKYSPEEVIVFDEVTYKSSTNIIENSQQLALAKMLAEEGRKVCIRERPEVIAKIKEEQKNKLFDFEEVEVSTV